MSQEEEARGLPIENTPIVGAASAPKSLVVLLLVGCWLLLRGCSFAHRPRGDVLDLEETVSGVLASSPTRSNRQACPAAAEHAVFRVTKHPLIGL
jgi:hypothetical protein